MSKVETTLKILLKQKYRVVISPENNSIVIVIESIVAVLKW